MLRGVWRNVAAKIIDFGINWIVPIKVRLVGQFLTLERILEECELEGGCGILRVLQTAGEPGHYCDTRGLYLGGSDEWSGRSGQLTLSSHRAGGLHSPGRGPDWASGRPFTTTSTSGEEGGGGGEAGVTRGTNSC